MIQAVIGGLVVFVVAGWLILELTDYGVLIRDGQVQTAAGIVSRQCTYLRSRGIYRISPAYDRSCLTLLRFG